MQWESAERRAVDTASTRVIIVLLYSAIKCYAPRSALIIYRRLLFTAANLGDLASNHEPTVTYEGDNNVLVQQTSNWILRQWADLQNGSMISSPLSSVSFLIRGPTIIQQKFSNYKTNELLSLKCKFKDIFILYQSAHCWGCLI